MELLHAICLATLLPFAHGAQPAGVHERRQAKPSIAQVQHQCTPDIPEAVVYSSNVVAHPAVAKGLGDIGAYLDNLTGPDTVSVAIVHGAVVQPVYTFNKGAARLNISSLASMNNSTTSPQANATADSIYRVNSITKSIVQLTALLLERRSPSFTLSMRLKDALPAFNLSEYDMSIGGEEITLDMLATHTSGLPREGYVTEFNLKTGTARATVAGIGALWAHDTPEDLLASVASQGLSWAPGEKIAYSNAGYNLLGYAVLNQWNALSNPRYATWSDLAVSEILRPLNMSHSFFGAVPSSLVPFASVPYGESWVDLNLGPGYDPAAGMSSSARDLASFLYQVWLKRDPSIISATARRRSLTPSHLLPDGLLGVGAGWELEEYVLDHSLYTTYGKGGDGGGQHAYISLAPSFGYGLAVLVSDGDDARSNEPAVDPSGVSTAVHNTLLPAFRVAYNDLLEQRFGGVYKPTDATGMLNSSALVELAGDALRLRHLYAGGVSALQRIDALSYTNDSKPVYYATPGGVALHPTSAKPTDSKRGMQAFSMAVDLDGVCDYLDFGGYEATGGWPVDRILFSEEAGQVTLQYPPLNINYVKS